MPRRRLSRSEREEYSYKPSKMRKRDEQLNPSSVQSNTDTDEIAKVDVDHSSIVALHRDDPVVPNNLDGVGKVIENEVFWCSTNEAEGTNARKNSSSELSLPEETEFEEVSCTNTQVEPSSPKHLSPYVLGMSYEHLVALILTSGTNRLTETMYDVIRSLLNNEAVAQNSGRKYPSVSTVKRKLHELAISRFYVRTQTVSLPSIGNKSSASLMREMNKSSHSRLKYVLPSQWAAMDVKQKSTRDIIWGDFCDSAKEQYRTMFSQFKDCPIARDRANMLSLFSLPDECGNDTPIKNNLPIFIHSVNMATTRRAFETYGIEVQNAKAEDKKTLLWCSSIKSYKLISDAPLEYSGKLHSYSSCSNYRNGDVVLEVQTPRGSGFLMFRALRLHGALADIVDIRGHTFTYIACYP